MYIVWENVRNGQSVRTIRAKGPSPQSWERQHSTNMRRQTTLASRHAAGVPVIRFVRDSNRDTKLITPCKASVNDQGSAPACGMLVPLLWRAKSARFPFISCIPARAIIGSSISLFWQVIAAWLSRILGDIHTDS